ncbi:SDR family NAD(P)-dependent oxidoreductase [Pseudactinotalea sp. Z1739]|uniref:SDR family NAD(P)-dependent oxidoreductase n=1 Tax=Pseudactinotalea sp. Z1739 TaxID=3413028 RepID=UPI003C7BC723
MEGRTSGGRPDLAGRVALVTGATGGIGRAESRRLAAAGATVAVNARRNTPELQALAEEIGGVVAPADIRDWEQTRAAIAQLEGSIGPVSVLVANHAAMTMDPLIEADLEDWWHVVDTNLGGTFNLIQSVLAGMRRIGEGRIVVVSSEWGVTGWRDASAYAASKSGLISLVKCLGRELGPEGIMVNAVAPGVIDTPQLQVDADAAGLTIEQMHDEYREGIPAGRLGQPEEIADLIAFLADFELRSFVGQTIQANGGTTRSRV